MDLNNKDAGLFTTRVSNFNFTFIQVKFEINGNLHNANQVLADIFLFQNKISQKT